MSGKSNHYSKRTNNNDTPKPHASREQFGYDLPQLARPIVGRMKGVITNSGLYASTAIPSDNVTSGETTVQPDNFMHEHELETEAGEISKSKAAPMPYTPTQEEVANHRISHWPYRSWCAFCVMGRGKALSHTQLGADAEHDIDTISVDYAYLGQNDETPFPVLVLRAHRSRWTEAIQQVSKGAEKYNIPALVQAIKRTGLTTFIFKSDQEFPLL